MRKSRFSDEQIIQAIKRVDAGMTIVDLPLYVDMSAPEEGFIDSSFRTAEYLRPVVSTAFAALPVCTVLEFVEAELRGPNSRPFARAGLATR